MGQNVPLKDLLDESINEIFEKNNDTNNIFKKVLKKFVEKNINAENFITSNNSNIDINIDNYEENLEELFNTKESSFMDDILKKAKSFTNGFGKDLIPMIYKDKFINKNSGDMITIIKDYISEKIFDNILMNIFNVLVDNNFLTTLLVLNKNKEKILQEKVLKEIKEKELKK